MKVDGALLATDLGAIGAEAARHEADGFDGVVSFEGAHDPFLQLVPAALATSRIGLATAIAIAFARNPMTVAYAANDLQLLARGRFVLGLGTQIRPHVEKRFGQPWSKPNARMREFVQALRAIFAAWAEGSRLDFRGAFYTHTLMPPFFDPGPNPWGPPRIFLAGYGPRMVRVAGEVGDGWFVHPLHSPSFVDAVLAPALADGLARQGRPRARFEVAAQTITMLGSNDEEVATARAKARAQIAFYASTPAYKVFLDHHGWGDLQPELNALSKQGRWPEMMARVSDAMLDVVGVSGTPARVAAALRARNAFADRTQLVLYNETEPDAVVDLVRAMRG